MDIAVLQFPGSNCDQDAFQLFSRGLRLPTRYVWHKDTRLGGADLVVLPGGFSYGDYLRCGAIARFSPVMGAVLEYARKGGLVLGIVGSSVASHVPDHQLMGFGQGLDLALPHQ